MFENISESDLVRKTTKFTSDFDVDALFAKIRKFALKVGCEGIQAALRLYYALDSPTLPAKVKAMILGALGYLISPIDLVPDLMPFVGFLDDVGVLTAAVGFAWAYIDSTAKAKADEKMISIFGTKEC